MRTFNSNIHQIPLFSCYRRSSLFQVSSIRHHMKSFLHITSPPNTFTSHLHLTRPHISTSQSTHTSTSYTSCSRLHVLLVLMTPHFASTLLPDFITTLMLLTSPILSSGSESEHRPIKRKRAAAPDGARKEQRRELKQSARR